MRKVRVNLGMGLVGCKRHAILEFEDDATQEDIDEAAEQWMWETISLWTEEVE